MLKITMLRHGKTEGNAKGRYIGITDEPILDEEKEALLKISFPRVQAVYVSPMKRCIQTAKILFPESGIVVIDELAECDFGRFEGKTYQELIGDPVYKLWVESGEIIAFPEGENRADFQARCLRGFDKTVADTIENKYTNIAMIVHGGTIMSILEAYGFPYQEYNKWYVRNGEGYRLRMTPETFTGDTKEIIVDGKIVRE